MKRLGVFQNENRRSLTGTIPYPEREQDGNRFLLQLSRLTKVKCPAKICVFSPAFQLQMSSPAE